MYGKIFRSIYEGTLADDWRALITFQQFIVLCDPDGIVDMTPNAISRLTGIPLDHIEHGISVLENPDKNSRTNSEDGKRIIRIDPDRPWGWQIVNHKHYKNLRTAEDRREYMRNYMRNKRSKQKLTNANESKQLTQLANTDTDTDTDTDTISNVDSAKQKKQNKSSRLPDDFIMPDEWIDWAIQERPELNHKIEAEKFKDYWISQTGQRATKRNWQATWRNWIRNAKGESNGSKTHTSRAKQFSDRIDELAKDAAKREGFDS